MIIFAVAAALFLLFIALVIFLPLEAGVEYLISGKNQKLLLYIRLLKIPLTFKIPLGKDKKKKANKSDKKSNDKPKKKMTLSVFCDKVRALKEAYGESKNDIKGILSDIRKRIEFKKIDFSMHFGLSDAAKTGIATGAAWASSSCLVSIINQMFGVRDAALDVNPDFNREFFNLRIKSILVLRPVHIIIIGIKILKIVNLFIEKMDSE